MKALRTGLGLAGALLMLVMAIAPNMAVAEDMRTATPGEWYFFLHANGFERDGLSFTVTQNGVDHTFTPKAGDWHDTDSGSTCEKGSGNCVIDWARSVVSDPYVFIERYDGDNDSLAQFMNAADKEMRVMFLVSEASGNNITVKVSGTKAGVPTTETKTVPVEAMGGPEMWLSEGGTSKGLGNNDCVGDAICQSTRQGDNLYIYAVGLKGTAALTIDDMNTSASVVDASIPTVSNIMFYNWSIPRDMPLGNYTATVKGTDMNGNATQLTQKFFIGKYVPGRCDEPGTKCYEPPPPGGHAAATWPPMVMWVPAPIGMGLLLVAGLYVRLKRESLFNNLARSRIFEHIKANPGVHFRGLVDGLHLKMGTVTHHINVLEREGHVKSYQDGMYRRFYMAGQRPPLQVTLTNIQERIMNIVQQNPGISQTEISTRAGSNRFVVNYHVRILQDVGMLLVERDGRNSKCFKMG